MGKEKIRVFSTCSGVGGFELGIEMAAALFEEIEIEVVGFAEIDKYANGVLKYQFPDVKNYGNTKKIDENKLPDFDVLVGGFPCFVEGTEIITKKGLKPIKKVMKGEQVLTHKGVFREVTNKMVKSYEGNLVTISLPYGFDDIVCTPEHPFFVRKKVRFWNNDSRMYAFKYSDPEWVEAKDLDNNSMILLSQPKQGELEEVTYEKGVNQSTTKEIIYDLSNDFLWCLGYYVADGWYQKRRKRNGKWCTSSRVYIASDRKITSFVRKRFESVVGKTYVENKKTCDTISFSDKGFWSIAKELGDKAPQKRFPEWIFSLSHEKLRVLIEGFLFAEGWENEDIVSTNSTSKRLIQQLRLALATLDDRIPTVSLVETPDTTVIEGRTVNQRNYWSLKHRKNPLQKNIYTYKDNHGLFVRIKNYEITQTEESIRVHNLEVREHNTYTVQGLAVHNCQAFSVAGRRKGFSDTRGTVFFDLARIAQQKQPRILVFENVKGLLSHDKGKTFHTIIASLDELGYDVQWQVLNSKNHGVPQNRERVFIVGHLRGTSRPEVFPFGGEDNGDSRQVGRDISTCLDKNYHKGTSPGDIHKQRRQHIITHYGHVDKPASNHGGVVPTLKAQSHGHEPMVYSIEKQVVDVGTLRTHKDGEGFRKIQDDVCPTIPARARNDGSGQPIITDYRRIRRLTPVECERLQGFIDDFTLYGIMDGKQVENSDTQRFKMMGNAVTTNVIRDVFARIFEVF